MVVVRIFWNRLYTVPCMRSFPLLLGLHGRESAAMKHGFVSELVTACKQLAPNLLNAKVDVSYIYIYII